MIVSGSLADFGRLRKLFLMVTVLIGSAFVTSIVLVTPSDCAWLLGTIFLIGSNVFVTVSTVFYKLEQYMILSLSF